MATIGLLSTKAIGQYHLPRQPRVHLTTLPGAVLLTWLAGVALLDWWFPIDTTNRAFPQTLRLVLVVLLSVYCLSVLPTLMRIKVAWFQLLWLIFMCARFLYTDSLEREDALYVGYYAIWIVVFWAAYCLSSRGHITTHQVAFAGTLMNAVTCVYDILFIYLGRRPGQPDAPVASGLFSLGEAYVLLWFLLMQALAPIKAFGAVVALTSVVVVIFGLERGALISMLLGLFVYSWVHAYIKHRTKRSGIRWLIPTLIAISLACYVAAGEIVARWSDLSDPAKAGSGRLRFWTTIADNWLNADVVTKLIGSGPRTVQVLLGNAVAFAHNDLLEQLHCFGIFGALLYVLVCLALLRECYLLIKRRSAHADVFCAATVVFISTGLYCIASYATSTVWFSLAAGVTLGTHTKSLRRKRTRIFRLIPFPNSHENPLLRQLGRRPVR